MTDVLRARLALLLFALASLLLTACSSQLRQPATAQLPHPAPAVTLSNLPSGVFPVDPGLQPQVDFWRHVFGHWSQAQVALHDERYVQVVYQVLTLPGRLTDDYRKEQRAYTKQQRERLQQQLQKLEDKLLAQPAQALDVDEQALADLIIAKAGAGAISGAAERLRSQRGLRERFKRGLEASTRYLGLFEAIFAEANLPKDLALLPHVESSFHPRARSTAGATGMWQFTRRTAKIFMTVNRALDERFDPVASARGAARYLSHAYDLLASWPFALTSYNHGITGMVEARRQFTDDFAAVVAEFDYPRFGFASRNFYTEFLAARDIARNAELYFPEGLNWSQPLNLDSVVLAKSLRASDLAFRYDVPLQTLVTLNPAWRRAAVRGRVRLPAGTEVWLPLGTLSDSPEQLLQVSNTNVTKVSTW